MRRLSGVVLMGVGLCSPARGEADPLAEIPARVRTQALMVRSDLMLPSAPAEIEAAVARLAAAERAWLKHDLDAILASWEVAPPTSDDAVEQVLGTPRALRAALLRKPSFDEPLRAGGIRGTATRLLDGNQWVTLQAMALVDDRLAELEALLTDPRMTHTVEGRTRIAHAGRELVDALVDVQQTRLLALPNILRFLKPPQAATVLLSEPVSAWMGLPPGQVEVAP